MISPSELTRIFQVSRNTLKNWGASYSDFLSDYANPAAAGTAREYTVDDARVFSLVAAMRKENALHEEILAALRAGERGLWPLSPPPRQETPEEAANTMQLVTQLTARASSLEGQLSATTKERDRLLSELETVRAAALDAEIRAAAAEAEARILKELGAAGHDSRGFWARLTNKKSP